jgi:hypothetical protein
MSTRIPSARRCTVLLAAAAAVSATVAACTPPWYRLLVVTAEGRLSADHTCSVATRGDMSSDLVLPTHAGYIHGDNLPRPLPSTTLFVKCGYGGPTDAPTDLTFLIPTPDSARGIVPGAYRVVSYDESPVIRAAPRTAAFFGTLPSDPARPADGYTRHYQAVGGSLVLSTVDLAPDGTLRVTGRFRVVAHRTVRFD